MVSEPITIALVGNPNSGKTTIFNAATGSRQRVANYPGVTVEAKEGRAGRDGEEVTVVDLPGTYSLTACSTEEIVTRNFILDHSPDVVVDVVDSSNLERNLYLAVQLIELGVPVVLAFNMTDLARDRGDRIDVAKLSALLGVPIVSTTAHRKQGIEAMLAAARQAARDAAGAVAAQRQPHYGGEVEPHVVQFAASLAQQPVLAVHSRWFALKLLEGDRETAKHLRMLCPEHAEALLEEAGRLRTHIRSLCGDSSEIVLADRRYGYIAGACAETVVHTGDLRRQRSDLIDAVVTHRYLGLPIFAVMMYLVFQLTFAVGNPIVDRLDEGKTMLAEQVRHWGGPRLLTGLLADGIIEGVGAVLVFLPLIALLYLGISVLEDSGYMARGAFVLDKLMHRIGLHGKSFVPMLIGFGCTVPAVMATRILETRRDRLTTMLILPLMSCGARLPIYVLLIGAFFPRRLWSVGPVQVSTQATLLFVIYATGVALAVLSAWLLRKTVLRGEVTPFVMELPPYRLPALRGLIAHVWERCGEYAKKAGTIILAIVIILWALKTWPQLPAEQAAAFDAGRAAVAAEGGQSQEVIRQRIEQIDVEQHRQALSNSAVGRIGRAVAPVMAPCGFDWRICTALLGSFVAKEVFISQLGVIYAVGEHEAEHSETLREKLTADYSPLQGFCIMLFLLIGFPCAATVAVTARESGSWRWAALQWGYLTALAWLVAAAVWQLGGLLHAIAAAG